jgi:membrane protease YdiL (CAAX protease family)
VIISPLHEEVVARGMLTSALYWPDRKWMTIVASAAIFSSLHFLMVQRPAQYVVLFVIGMLLAWSFLRTRSIVTSFVLHSVFNLGVLIKDLVILKDPGFVRRILGYE